MSMTPQDSRVTLRSGYASGVVVMDVDARAAGESCWLEDVQFPSAAVMAAVNDAVNDEALRSLTCVVHTSPENLSGELEEALLQAVRGVAGTAALELGPRSARVNVVVVTSLTASEDLNASLEYLLDDVRAGYTTGATLDLRQRLTSPRSTSGTVLVTGGAGSLGLSAAMAIAGQGRRVVLSDRAGDALESAGRFIDAPTLGCDLSRPEDLARLADSDVLGELDALVLHHGVSASTRFGDAFDATVSDRSLALNGTAVYDVVELLLPRLRRAGGTIVILASQAGLYAEEGNGPYCAAKYAAVGYGKSLAKIHASSGITVQTLCPGPIDTPLLRAAFAGFAEGMGLSDEDFLRQRLSGIPLGRIGEPGQIGAASALLLGLNATAVVLAPNGGERLT